MSSEQSQLNEALEQSIKQTSVITEVKNNKATYDKKGDQLSAVVNPNNESSEPATAYDPKYPYNDSKVSESGHSFEMDDTPGAERVALTHRTGTFFEVHPDGSKMEKIYNDNVQIVVKNNEIYIMGNEKKSTQGNVKLYVKGNVKLQIDADVEMQIGGSLMMNVDGDFTAKAESFNFVGDINHVGDFLCTGNIVNQGNIASAKNIQAQQDFVGLRNFSLAGDSAIAGNETIGGTETVTGKVTAADVTVQGVGSLSTHKHTSTTPGTPTSGPTG
jgi:hypothetical protein